MLAVVGTGLVSGVGLTADESCSAIRCGINKFRQTRFVGRDREWLVGSEVDLEEPWRGASKLAKMAARAIGECLGARSASIPVLLAVAETERPGRIASPHLLADVERELGTRLHPHSRLIEQGRVAGAVALLHARRLLLEARSPHVIVAGVDSFFTAPTLAFYDRDNRLLRRTNSNGFIPGEAAAAVLLSTPAEGVASPLLLRGLGFAREPAPFGSGQPLRAEGLVRAMRAALSDAGITLKDCDHRIADLNGEQYRFKEDALAVTRLLRERKRMFSVWHLGDCIGEIGAATVPAMLAALTAGARHDYLPGPVFLGHVGNDDDKRGAFVVQATTPQTLALEAAAESAFSMKRRRAA
jgi:3-oxoacyl-[acyl-carrier-protein] synthase-1